MSEELFLRQVPLWELEDGTWESIKVGDPVQDERTADDQSGRKGIITRIVPVDAPNDDRLPDYPERYKQFGDLYVIWGNDPLN